LGNVPSGSGQPSLQRETSTNPITVTAETMHTATMSIPTSCFAKQVDVVIKANSAAQVILSSEAIAAEVLRTQEHHKTLNRGTSVFREH